MDFDKVTEKALGLLVDEYPIYEIDFDRSNKFHDETLFVYYGGISGAKAVIRFLNRFIGDYMPEMKKRKLLGVISNDYIEVVTSQLKNTLLSYELVDINNQKFYYQKNATIKMFEPGMPEFIIEDVDEAIFEDIVRISQTRYEITNKLKLGLDELLQIEKTDMNTESTTSHSKLGINLSVPEIALLFRLLDEENIVAYKHKTEMYRHIANTLKTAKQDSISESSVKNKFLSPDNTAITNMKVLLTNMKIALNKL